MAFVPGGISYSDGTDAYPDLLSEVRQVAVMFETAGYDVVGPDVANGSVESFKAMSTSDDGFVSITGHGGAGNRRPVTPAEEALYRRCAKVPGAMRDVLCATDPTRVFTAVTATPVSAANEALYKADLDAGRLAYMNGYYAITARFVQTYVRLADHSMVFLNICRGAQENVLDFTTSNPRDLVNAFLEDGVGADVVFAWTDYVNSTRALRYFSDRMLGANAFLPEKSPQRPFGWPVVLEDMARKGLDARPDGTARLIPLTAPRSPLAGHLAPSVKLLIVCADVLFAVLECDRGPGALGLAGSFGLDPGAEGAVWIEDPEAGVAVPLRVVQWDTSHILVDGLPDAGPGSVGDVFVVVRGVRSNPRRLLGWTGQLHYELLGPAGSSLRQDVTITLDARVDPPWVRHRPGEEPRDTTKAGGTRFNLLIPRLTARGVFSASGLWTRREGECTYTTSWNSGGVRPLPPHRSGGPPTSGFRMYGAPSVKELDLRLLLSFGVPDAVHEVTTWVCPDDEGGGTEKSVPVLFVNAFAGLTLPLDPDLGIRAASTLWMPVGEPEWRGERVWWDRIPARPPFVATQPR
jgi:hypothetical protein